MTRLVDPRLLVFLLAALTLLAFAAAAYGIAGGDPAQPASGCPPSC